MRRASKTDSTHAEVRQALRSCGLRVLDTSRYPGFTDFLVGCPRTSRMWLIDAKTPKNKAGGFDKTDQQAKLERAGWEIIYLTSASEALAWARETT